MNVVFSTFFALLLLLSCSKDAQVAAEPEAQAQLETAPTETSAIASVYEIAVWKNFTQAAITHTWDDNTANQLTVALPLYDAYNMQTTFFTVTDWGPNWDVLKKAAANGHEVASHSVTHTRFDELSEEQIAKELEESRDAINERLNANACLTFAYSNCIAEDYGLTKKFYIAARDCDGQVEAPTPTDFMKISSFLCGSQSNNKTAESFNAIAANALNENGWAVYLFHGIDNDGGYSPIESAELEEHLQFLAANSDTYWVDTFVNITKYIKERDTATTNELSQSENKITAELTDDLDDSIYNYPLTVKREIPLTWAEVEVTQDGEPVNFSIEEGDEKKYVIFDAVPDAGILSIKKI
ncbi:polysaccharide deacetylase family protein [Leeuwenhoekiella sp. A16]|uniref:polysaccharide deacetylase family protein n=1 Tax=unclassified Leeuwenhoekiella TaxID=2615029 RepID=UPI003A7FEB86